MKKEVLIALVAALIKDEISKHEKNHVEVVGHRGPRGFDGKDFDFTEHQDKIFEQIESVFQVQKDGLKLKFSDLTPDDIESLRGSSGRDGKSFNIEEHRVEILTHLDQLFDASKESFKLKFSDLAQEEILSLIGPSGKDGESFDWEKEQGQIKNLISDFVIENRDQFKLKFDDLSPEEISSIIGPRGRDGKDGIHGEDGKDFVFVEHEASISSLVAQHLSDIKDSLKLRFDDLSDDEKMQLRGPRGQRGKQGHDFIYDEHKDKIEAHIDDSVFKLAPSLKMKFSDLTDEEKLELKLKFEDLTEEERFSLRGPRGQRGKPGQDFTWEDHETKISNKIEDFISSIRDDLKLKFSDLTKPEIQSLKLKFSDLSELEKFSLRGKEGKAGSMGADGKDAPTIIDVRIVQRSSAFYFVFSFSDNTTVETNLIDFPVKHSNSLQVFNVGGGSEGGTSDSATKLTIKKILGENIGAFKFVTFINDTTVMFADNLEYGGVCDGITLSGGVTGDEVEVLMFGIAENTGINLPLKTLIMLGSSGEIITSRPLVGYWTIIGRSLGSGSIFIDIKEPELIGEL